jgi:hypothetical protein
MTRIVGCLVAAGFLLGSAGALAAADLFIYPSQGQSPEQQEQDEFSCYKWAKAQSGVDPSSPGRGPDRGRRAGSTLGGAARGAGLGAAVGAIAGDAGKGAAAGAVVGGARGRRRGIQRERYEAASERNSYDRAFAACMEARGYTVK